VWNLFFVYDLAETLQDRRAHFSPQTYRRE